MPDAALPTPTPPVTPWRPERCQGIALILQGGGALGSYQAGVYQALHESGLEPDWVAGISIGGINGAIIAGNDPRHRLDRLREFWETITARQTVPGSPWQAMWTSAWEEGRKFLNGWSSLVTATLGQPGFFTPHATNPWLSAPGTEAATSFYDSAPLRATLERLVDFDRLNSGATRYAAGAVEVTTGNFGWFDNEFRDATDHPHDIIPGRISVEKVMASGALPPALPAQRVGHRRYGDGGLVSNTPLQHLVDHMGEANMLVFQVDLFSARGPMPRNMDSVLTRQKDIQYSSRSRAVTDHYARHYRRDVMLRDVLQKLPDSKLSPREREEKRLLLDLPELAIFHLIYRQHSGETQAKDYEFSPQTMRAHWASGYQDTRRTLRRKDWLKMPGKDGIVIHDIHHVPPPDAAHPGNADAVLGGFDPGRS